MNPMLQAALGAILRWAFTFAAGWFVQHGIWTGSEAQTYIAGGALATLTLAWTLWNKYRGRIKFLTALTMEPDSTESDVDRRVASSIPNPSVSTPKDQTP